MTTHGPTRHQVLIPLDIPTVEVVVANAATAVESCNRGLVEAHSKLRVESVRKAFFFFCSKFYNAVLDRSLRQTIYNR